MTKPGRVQADRAKVLVEQVLYRRARSCLAWLGTLRAKAQAKGLL
jgi:hypothetical protein